MSRWWWAVRLRLPWWLVRWTRPSEALVLDWWYTHGWGRDDSAWRRPPEPVRPGWDRAESTPQHMCRGRWAGAPDGDPDRPDECACFDELVSGDLVVRGQVYRGVAAVPDYGDTGG